MQLIPEIMSFVKVNISVPKAFLLIALLLIAFGGYAQTDTEFWFSVPEVNRYHSGGTETNPDNNGTPVYLRLTTSDKPANVVISMPANPAFTPISISIPANSTHTEIMNSHILNGAGKLPGTVNIPQSIENVLAWTTSNLGGAMPYINKNNKGVYIKSDNNITAYYEIGVLYNMDLIALKGKNALGKKFYVPFQTTNNTRSYPYNYRPYSSIDIVATEDNTKIKITVPHPIWVKGGASATLPAGTHSIWLNAGETSIITPYQYNEDKLYQTTFSKDFRLAGALVEVDAVDPNSSGGNIAIITHDDLVQSNYSGNPDYVVDQLVPIDHIGTDYVVIQGINYSATEYEDAIFVVGTEPGTTNFTVKFGPGGATANYTVDEGKSVAIPLDSGTKRVATIKSDKPVYTFHMSGAGRQKAGALIPTISDCTGSSRVAFNRTKGGTYKFYLNILVWHTAVGKFKLYKKNTSTGLLEDVTATLPALNNVAGFSALPETGVPYDNWRYARIDASALATNEAYLIVNDDNVFHLGVLNGETDSDAFYGYFSNFNQFEPTAVVGPYVSPSIKLCYGESTQLEAGGGTKYSWSPTTFLDNPNIATPNVVFPTATTKYTVTVKGACNLEGTADVTVNVSQPLNPEFIADTLYGCGATTINFEALNTGDAYMMNWYVKKEGEPDPGTKFHQSDLTIAPLPVNSHKAAYNFINTTSAPITYIVNLEVLSNSCTKVVSKSIIIYPAVSVAPTVSIPDASGCQPLTVNFQANPVGNYGTAYFNWEFGDGGSSAVTDPTHIYKNLSDVSKTFWAKVKLTDQWNFCSDKDSVQVVVQPYVKASFVIDQVEGCSPFAISVVNDSKGGITSYKWDKDGNLATGINGFESTDGGNWSNTYTNDNVPTNTPDQITIRLRVQNSNGCIDDTMRTITVNPRATAAISRTFLTDEKCSPLDVKFDATTTNADTYHWMIDGNAVDNVTSTTYTFENYTDAPVNKTVTFTANNQWGCAANPAPLVIPVQPYVNASIALSVEEGCSPLNVEFTNASSAGATVFQWNIGGVTYTTKDVAPQTYTYPAASNNTFVQHSIPVTLTAQNTAGCTDTEARTIKVNPRATASFVYNIVANANLCSPVDVNFDGTYVNAETYQWQFGDLGASVIQDPFFQLTNTTAAVKPVNVVLTATNRFGCAATPVSQSFDVQPEIKAQFSLSNATGCAPFTFDVDAPPTSGTYSWNIERGTNAFFTGTGNSHSIDVTENKTGNTESYFITLTASNGTCTDVSAKKVVLAYPEVEAKWSLPNDIPSGCSPYALTGTNQSTLYNKATVLTNVLWEITDGATYNTSAITQSVTRNLVNDGYQSPKPYTVTLTATSADGCVATKTSTFNVNPPVVAAFNAEVINECTPLQIRFTDASNVETGTAYVWNWDGGVDASAPVGENYVKQYDNANPETVTNKTVTLSLTNSYGCSGNASYSFQVNPRVVAGLSLGASSADRICAPDDIEFVNTSTGGSLEFTWDFGDGNLLNVSNRNDVTHGYENKTPNPIPRTVTLTARNSLGCTNALPATLPITVYPEVVADYTLQIDSICSPTGVTVTNNSLNGTDFTWTFTPTAGAPINVNRVKTDGPFSQLLPNAAPSESNLVYTVGLTARTDHRDGGGNILITCPSTAPTRTVTVAPELSLNMIPNETALCSDAQITFTNQSTGGNLSFAWDFNDGTTASSIGSAAAKPSVLHAFTNLSATDVIRNVLVTATNSNGCVRQQRIPIRVHPKVTSEFSLAVNDVCTYPLPVTLTNSSLNGTEFLWDFDKTGIMGAPQTALRTDKTPFVQTFTNPTLNDDRTFTVELHSRTIHTATSGKTCEAKSTKTLTVSPELLPAFTPDEAYGCSDHTTAFTNSSTGGLNMNYYWDFGNTESATTVGIAAKPQQTFVYRGSADSTVYTIGLTATNKHGCQRSTSAEVTVYPKVEAEFGYVSDSVCTPYYIVVTNSSLNGKQFNWDFGHSVAGTLRDTTTLKSANSFRFLMDNESPNTIGNYTITLTASHQHLNALCSDTYTRPIQVYPRLVTEFAIDDNEGCNPLPVRFTNQSTGLGTYLWELGDGTTSTSGATISKEYKHSDRENIVRYPILLTSTNANGCRSAKRDTVTVYPLVKANYQVSQINGCTPLQVNVTNTSPSSVYTYLWEYGDGRANTTQVNPGAAGMVEYVNTTQNTPQIQRPRLRLTTRYVGDNTCVDTTSKVFTVYPHVYPDFTADLEGCHPHDVSFANQTDVFSANTTYLWDFGNSVTANSLSPDFRFVNDSKTQDVTYDVWLKAISEHGCTDSTRQVVTVHPRPKAVMDVVGKFIDCPPFDVQVRNRSLGTNLTSTYNFGDGTANVVNANALVNHRFNNPNSTTEPYVINLHVNSEFGCDDNTSQTVYVYPKVTASYHINPQLADCSPFMVTLANQTSNALYYSWDFGNGLTSVNENPFHRFTNTTPNDITYDIRLYAESEFECNDDTVQTITVYATPVPDFVIDPPLKIFPDATFALTNQTSPANASWTYNWSYGDGYVEDKPLSPLSFDKTYSKWGPKDKQFQYTVTLNVTTPNCPRTISRNLTLLPAEPVTTFSVDTEADCSPLEANFTNLSQYGSTFFWDFGDGTTSTEEEPVHVFTEPGYYNVKLTVTGDGGVTHFFKTLQVYRNPVAKFQVAPKRAMLPKAEVRFFNLTEYGHKYVWDFGDGTGVSYDESPLHTYTKLGEYRVTLTAESENGCVDVYSEFPAVWVEGAGYLDFPNAFVPSLNGPNGGYYDEIDYKNEVFHPVHDGVIEYQLLIFNRWGEQIYESKDVKVGWDGYRDGKICEQGVYVWRAVGKFTNGKLFNIRGNVTLLR